MKEQRIFWWMYVRRRSTNAIQLSMCWIKETVIRLKRTRHYAATVTSIIQEVCTQEEQGTATRTSWSFHWSRDVIVRCTLTRRLCPKWAAFFPRGSQKKSLPRSKVDSTIIRLLYHFRSSVIIKLFIVDHAHTKRPFIVECMYENNGLMFDVFFPNHESSARPILCWCLGWGQQLQRKAAITVEDNYVVIKVPLLPYINKSTMNFLNPITFIAAGSVYSLAIGHWLGCLILG